MSESVREARKGATVKRQASRCNLDRCNANRFVEKIFPGIEEAEEAIETAV